MNEQERKQRQLRWARRKVRAEEARILAAALLGGMKVIEWNGGFLFSESQWIYPTKVRAAEAYLASKGIKL